MHNKCVELHGNHIDFVSKRPVTLQKERVSSRYWGFESSYSG